MVERLNEGEVDGNNDEVANALFKEVLGQRSGYARGLGHSVILDPSPSLRNNRDYQRICEENKRNKNNAYLYKSKLEALHNDLVTFKNNLEDYEKGMTISIT